METIWDCVIVGGGAAGLSAGLVLGRARRRTLLVDAGQQSNLSAHGIGGLLGSDGRPPAELYAAGRAELAGYPSVEIRDGEVVAGARDGDDFELRLGDGTQVRTRRVLLATGMEYRPPPVPGLAALWGQSVFHCPFCHGWEVRDRPLAVLAAGERGVHSALLLRGWSDDVILLTDGPAELDADNRGRLAAAGVSIDERVIAELLGEDGELTAVAFADGRRLPRRGLLVGTVLHQRSALAEQLGAEAAPQGPLAADALLVDPFCRTSAPGVFAAGDVSAAMPQVAAAVAGGSLAGAAVMQSLMADDFGLQVPTLGDARVGTR
jgi:thioredoxin reductase